jgi:hypothetical protein
MREKAFLLKAVPMVLLLASIAQGGCSPAPHVGDACHTQGYANECSDGETNLYCFFAPGATSGTCIESSSLDMATPADLAAHDLAMRKD